MLKMPLDTAIAESEDAGSKVQVDGNVPSEADGGAALLSFSKHKASIVLGGTKILQHSPGSQPAAIQPPGGGAVGYVLRTGFYSSPGQLIRTILFASERATENSKETFVFIIFLLSFALAAAGYVLMHGLEDPTRSRWRLLLHCTMILTSVVPPELPMELSLAVNNSLLALHKLGIYCTEPFRIPYAGRCHVCCFDKTGTLTLSDLIVEGVAIAAHRTAAKADKGQATDDSQFIVVPAKQAPLTASFVLAGCHQLVASAGGKLLGDPMERAALLAAGWTYLMDGSAISELPLGGASLSKELLNALPRNGTVRPALRIIKRFPFSSELKRSAAIVETSLLLGSARLDPTGPVAQAASKCGAAGLQVLAKGSPEAVRTLLATVPDGYDATYMQYASSGKRVLALATKPILSGITAANAQSMRRDEAERELTFCGFLVLHCPPRPESREVLESLASSGHTLQMLTGDSLLTATHTAYTLGLSSKPALLLQVETITSHAPSTTPPVPEVTEASLMPKSVCTPIEKYISARAQKGTPDGTSSEQMECELRWAAWHPDKPSLDIGAATDPSGALAPGGYLRDLSASTFRELARRFDLCVGGDGFAALESRGALAIALPYLRVLARMSPAQKETALSTLASCGLVTMMCGDGTNDVGALKQSAVGVALVSTSLVAPPPPHRKAAARPMTAAEHQQSGSSVGWRIAWHRS